MEEFIHPVEEDSTPEDQLPGEERQKRKNERLLEACMADETDKALQALDDGADPCFEDLRAVLNESGNSPHSSSQSPSDGHFVKYTPLHWAAYKGHLKIVWLLLKNGMSPHATDILGNTVLHQAVAGGSLPVVKTLLSSGVEVQAVNKRGHTALEVACDEDVKALLRTALSTTRCAVTGEYFSSRVPRYMCSFTEKFYAREAVRSLWMYDTPEAEEKERPAVWCEQVHQAVSTAENRLRDALEVNSLEKLNRALQSAADLPVCPKLQDQINRKKLKLEGELALRRAMQLPNLVHEDDYYTVMSTLKAALATAENNEASDERCGEARRLLQCLEVELALTKLLKKPSYPSFVPNPPFKEAVADAITAAMELKITSPVLSRAIDLKERIEKHLILKARVDATEEVSKIEDYFDLKSEKNALLPDWAKDPGDLENVILALRAEIADAKATGVAEELISIADGERLKRLETLLIEMKRRDEERVMKKSRKKSKKKTGPKK